jgi:hypothetical protein
MSIDYCFITLIAVSANDDWKTIQKVMTVQNIEFTTHPENQLRKDIPVNPSIRNQEDKFSHGRILNFNRGKFVVFTTKLQ